MGHPGVLKGKGFVARGELRLLGDDRTPFFLTVFSFPVELFGGFVSWLVCTLFVL